MFARRRFARGSWSALFLALLLSMIAFIFFPGKSFAHAVLLRSDPVSGAVLRVAPKQVHLWFSEDLNSALSTVQVVNAANRRVDLGDAHVERADPTRMDVTLQPGLVSSVYMVLYRSVASDDGHIMNSSFSFTLALVAGPLPSSQSRAHTVEKTSLRKVSMNQGDGSVGLMLLLLAGVECLTVFWLGSVLWQVWVLHHLSEKDAFQSAANQRARERFARYLAIPTLGMLVLANSGVLVEQALMVTGGEWTQAFSPGLLITLGTSGHFGFFWLLREAVLLLALLLSIAQWHLRRHSARETTRLRWLLLLCSLLFAAMLSLSSHAAAVSSTLLWLALPADWLHLIAAGLWVGGMLYLAMSYLPAQRQQPLPEQARGLLTVLAAYSPWAITGVVLMTFTGPISATVHLTSWNQLVATTYGLVLMVKIILVGAMVGTSALHVFLLRPRLQRAYDAYTQAQAHLQEVMVVFEKQAGQSAALSLVPAPPGVLATRVQECEACVARQTRLLSMILQWEPALGVAVLVCVSVMNVFAGSLASVSGH